jgi:hypothetical protein
VELEEVMLVEEVVDAASIVEVEDIGDEVVVVVVFNVVLDREEDVVEVDDVLFVGLNLQAVKG